MPPISLHLNDPIKPQTEKTEQSTNASTAPTKTVTTTINQQLPSSGQTYPPAQPGAAAMPVPTGYVAPPRPAPSRTIPDNQAPLPNYNPPPPRPGAVPAPPNQFHAPITSAHPQITPAPPQPGAVPVSAPFSQGAPATHPITAGQAPEAAQSTPFTAPTNIYAHAAPFISPREDGPPTTLPHPGAGAYQQNVYAQDLTPAQRVSLQEQERQENPHAAGSLGGVGLAGPTGESLTASVSDAAGNAWNVVKGLASGAGEKLVEVEKEVWKRINKD